MTKKLRSGYTTGACAAAAAKGAALMLTSQAIVTKVTLELPAGDNAEFQLYGQEFSEYAAHCFVIKDAGDDPDITNSAEVHAEVSCRPDATYHNNALTIEGGRGIGKVTKPGLAVPPGEWAINPVPRQMITAAVATVLAEFKAEISKYKIVISIPDGEERAKKTLNARLGIIGGLSILGTTGIVRPISAKAWTDTIDAALDVAKACECASIVLSTGRTSELAAQKHLPSLPEEACIMMGDHVAYALQACAKRGFMEPIIACQFAKLLKIACGYANTHAAASELDLAEFLSWVADTHTGQQIIEIIANANTAREIAVATNFDSDLMQLVARRAIKAAATHAPTIKIQPLLCRYDGTVVSLFSIRQETP